MTHRVPTALGLSVTLLGVLVSLTPKWLLPICEHLELGISASGFQPTMRCYWFGQSELLLGSCVAAAGMILMYRPHREVQIAIGTMLLPLGAAVGAVSFDCVIGSLCQHQQSLCQVGTKPAVRLAAGLIVIIGIIALFVALRDSERP